MKDEDGKLIYDFCGFKYCESNLWLDPDGKICLSRCSGEFPFPLDSNFYFKYAVPKLQGEHNGAWLYEFLRGWIIRIAHFNEDPAEALGQALLKLIREIKQ